MRLDLGNLPQVSLPGAEVRHRGSVFTRFRGGGSDAFVGHGEILVRVIPQQRRSDDADDAAGNDIPRYSVAAGVGSEQCRCYERSRPPGDDRGKLIAETGATVTQPRSEGLRDQ